MDEKMENEIETGVEGVELLLLNVFQHDTFGLESVHGGFIIPTLPNIL